MLDFITILYHLSQENSTKSPVALFVGEFEKAKASFNLNEYPKACAKFYCNRLKNKTNADPQHIRFTKRR